MVDSFKKNLASLVRNPGQKKFLLAVSGGIDSVVMADFFYKGGYTFAIAHCNFQLRGKESDGDEQFVKALADRYDVPFYVRHFDTEGHAANHKISVQMAARDLRYTWFNECMTEEKYDCIAIAHHADDAVETFFINLLRGTGIAGLHGIASVHQSIIRPMLPFSRKEIEAYAKEHNMSWREDSSNASDKYERNKIRHHLLPLLQQIAPDAPKAIRHTIENLSETELVYRKAVEEKLGKITGYIDGKVSISVSGLKKLELAYVYLYEFIKQFGFNYTQAVEICEALDGQPGKVFLSPTHRLIKDRRSLVIDSLPGDNGHEVYTISKEDKNFSGEKISFSITLMPKPEGYRPFHPPATACLDYEKLTFPLILRKWVQGDKFYPLGMDKPKKVSDFLVDAKVSLPDKEHVYVMLSGSDIVWVVGHRIDDRFKIAPATKKLYICNTVNTE